MTSRENHAPALRCLLVLAAVTTAVATVVVLLADSLLADSLLPVLRDPDHLASATFGDLLTQAAGLVFVGCLLWFWVVTLTTCVEAATAFRVAIGPRHWRGVVLLACGLTFAAGVAPATAGTAPVPVPGGAEVLTGLPLPDRPSGSTSAPPGTPDSSATDVRPAAQVTDPATITLRPGDTLWRLASDRLADGATDAEIDRHWRLIWQENREAIGPDPDLVHPGTTLHLPPLTPSADLSQEKR